MLKNINKRPLYMTDEISSLNELEQKVATQLFEDGFAILEKFIDPNLIDKAVSECEGKYSNKSVHHNENRRIQEAWNFSKAVFEIACDKNIVNLLTKIYGRRAFPFQTLNFEVGTEQKLHSDTIHFNSLPNFFMTGVWVAFEDVSFQNGPVRYILKSHEIPIFNCDQIGMNIAPGRDPYLYYHEYETFVEKFIERSQFNSQYAEIKKGDIFIWSSNLIHGGSKIQDPKSTRLSQVTHYFYDDCVYFTPLTSDLRNGKIDFRLPMDISRRKKISLLSALKNMRNEGLNISSIINSILYKKFRI